MANENLPKINEKIFYITKEVIVLKLIEALHLAQIQYLDSSDRYIVDVSILRPYPDKSCSISIRY